MTESTKTISTVAVAAVLLVLAIVSRPKLPYAEKEGEIGQPLFTEWKDPTAAKSMEIATFDEATQAVRNFKVALVDGKWCVPSHGNYPANAEDHVVKAASDLINLKVIEVVSDAQGSHETYGVVEPDPVKLRQPAVGVGKLVTVKDKDGKDLARLIIGKEDKPAGGSETSSSLRFVRRAGQDRVYKAALATDLFSTKFPDWIDSDLLGLKQHWDITKLQIRDYNLEERGQEIGVARKSDIALEYNDPKASWTVSKLTDYKNDKPTEAKLAADEELDTAKLNDAKMNLSGLKIADVKRKPAPLAEKLKKNKTFFDDAESQDSLANKGFVPLPEKKPTDVFSAGGDMTVGMKDGVEYTIRFGGVDLTLRDKDDAKDKKTAAKSADDQKRTNAERVVFVTARFNEDLIAKPTLEPLPEAKKTDEKKPDAGKAPDKAPATSPAPTKPPAASPASGKAPDNKAPSAKKSAEINRGDMLLALADEPAAKGGAKQPEAAQPAAPNPAAAKPDDKPPAAKPAESKAAGDGKKPGADKNPPSDIKRADEEKALDEQRKRVETENKRKQDEYDASVKKGKEHAKQLNDRFADWYFLISDEDYKKVHVGPADIIKKKTPAEGAGGSGLGPVPTDPFQKGK
ncbi:MAG TPA: DUF4340 domain-containing protein [Pirellulales bacterium]|jgi:hypothetical protein|nr:DUF4340 domain-containing protein [Pirellulales bacterium]